MAFKTLAIKHFVACSLAGLVSTLAYSTGFQDSMATQVRQEEYTITFKTAGADGTLTGDLTQTIKAGGACSPVVAVPGEESLFNFWVAQGMTPQLGSTFALENIHQNLTVTAHFGKKGPLGYNQPATNIVGKDATGADVSLADYYGNIIVLDFSTGWCVPCNKQAEQYEALHKKYQSKGVKCVTILVQGYKTGNFQPTAVEDLKKWVDAHQETMRVMSDATAPSIKQSHSYKYYDVEAFPSFFILDKHFNLYYSDGGLEDVDKKLEAILK